MISSISLRIPLLEESQKRQEMADILSLSTSSFFLYPSLYSIFSSRIPGKEIFERGYQQVNESIDYSISLVQRDRQAHEKRKIEDFLRSFYHLFHLPLSLDSSRLDGPRNENLTPLIKEKSR